MEIQLKGERTNKTTTVSELREAIIYPGLELNAPKFVCLNDMFHCVYKCFQF